MAPDTARPDAGNTFIARAYDSDGATYNYVMADVDKVDTSMKDPGQWQTYYSTTYGTGMIWGNFKVLYRSAL